MRGNSAELQRASNTRAGARQGARAREVAAAMPPAPSFRMCRRTRAARTTNPASYAPKVRYDATRHADLCVLYAQASINRDSGSVSFYGRHVSKCRLCLIRPAPGSEGGGCSLAGGGCNSRVVTKISFSNFGEQSELCCRERAISHDIHLS